MPRFTVCIDWTDAANPLCSDVDEVIVNAADSASAITKAKARWRTTIGSDHPSCRIDGAFALTRAIRENPDSVER